MDDVERLRGLLEKATPGPWAVKPVRGYCDDEIVTEHPEYAPDRIEAQHRDHIMAMADGEGCPSYIGTVGLAGGHPKQNFQENAALIVAAVNALPDLLATIARLERENAGLREVEQEANFLCARLREFENQDMRVQAFREFQGHVTPSIARLEMSLAKLDQGRG